MSGWPSTAVSCGPGTAPTVGTKCGRASPSYRPGRGSARRVRTCRRGRARRRPGPSSRRWLDWAFASAWLVAMEIEALTSADRRGPVALNVVVVAAMALASLWRRRAPLSPRRRRRAGRAAGWRAHLVGHGDAHRRLRPGGPPLHGRGLGAASPGDGRARGVDVWGRRDRDRPAGTLGRGRGGVGHGVRGVGRR